MGFHPYLYFDGNCHEAFTQYHEIFGGNLIIMRGNEAPPDAGIPEDKRDLVMHASLLIDGALLMASDSYNDSYAPMAGMSVHYSTHDLDHAKEVFAALADGGTVHAEGRAEFWTPYYGSCTDRFGTPWQISVETDQDDAG
jgi:PhnB protein